MNLQVGKKRLSEKQNPFTKVEVTSPGHCHRFGTTSSDQ